MEAPAEGPGPARFEVGGPLPARAGIGLRAPHYRDVHEGRPDVGFIEVHAENYFGDGGAPLAWLEAIRPHYPLSIHCVGLGLGSVDPLDAGALRRLRSLVERFEPSLVSDHLCWSSFEGEHFNDLLPLPFTHESLAHVAERIERVQDAVGAQLLVENLSSYLEFAEADFDEPDFLNELARRSGCALLLDVNNVYVSACNHGFDAGRWIEAIDPRHVGEIHLAGHAVNDVGGVALRIDDHGSAVCEAVWALFDRALAHLGPVPALVEWDTDIPPLDVLVAEADEAERRLEAVRAVVA